MAGRTSKILCVTVAAAALASGCGGIFSPKPSMYQQLQSDQTEDRIDGIRAAGESRDPKAVPLLIDRLEDDDPGVRLFAIQALQRITGKTLGYQYFAAEHDRCEAVARWRHWRGGADDGPALQTAHKGG